MPLLSYKSQPKKITAADFEELTVPSPAPRKPQPVAITAADFEEPAVTTGLISEPDLAQQPEEVKLAEDPLKNLAESFFVGGAEGLTTVFPEMIGETGQFIGEKTGFDALAEAGKRLAEWSKGKATEWYGSRQRTGLERIVYEGTKMLIPSLLPFTLFSRGFAALRGIGTAVKAAKAAKTAEEADLLWKGVHLIAKQAQEVGSAATGALYGVSAAQQSINTARQRADELESQGKIEEAQKMRETAKGIAPLAVGVVEGLGEYAGTKYLGKLFRLSEAEVLRRGGKEIVKDLLKSLGVEVGTEVGQQYGEAAIERAAGIRPDAHPLAEALDVIGPVAFMTLLTGMGAASVGKIRADLEPPPSTKADEDKAIIDDLSKASGLEESDFVLGKEGPLNAPGPSTPISGEPQRLLEKGPPIAALPPPSQIQLGPGQGPNFELGQEGPLIVPGPSSPLQSPQTLLPETTEQGGASPKPETENATLAKEVSADINSIEQQVKKALDEALGIAIRNAGQKGVKHGDFEAIHSFIDEVKDDILTTVPPGDKYGKIVGLFDKLSQYADNEIGKTLGVSPRIKGSLYDVKGSINDKSPGIFKPLNDWKKAIEARGITTTPEDIRSYSEEETLDFTTDEGVKHMMPSVVVVFKGKVPFGEIELIGKKVGATKGISSGFHVDQAEFGDTVARFDGVTESQFKERFGIREEPSPKATTEKLSVETTEKPEVSRETPEKKTTDIIGITQKDFEEPGNLPTTREDLKGKIVNVDREIKGKIVKNVPTDAQLAYDEARSRQNAFENFINCLG